MNLIKFKEELTTDLKERIGKDTEVYVLEECYGLKRFYANGQVNNAVVTWITERPTIIKSDISRNTSRWMLRRFYELLINSGLENVHLTDFVKIKAEPGKKPTKKELEVSAEWMRKEIEILRIKGKKMIIIANAGRVQRWMNEYLSEYECKYIQFYGWCLTRGKSKVDLPKKLKQIYKNTI